jgi:hypothetical protein
MRRLPGRDCDDNLGDNDSDNGLRRSNHGNRYGVLARQGGQECVQIRSFRRFSPVKASVEPSCVDRVPLVAAAVPALRATALGRRPRPSWRRGKLEQPHAPATHDENRDVPGNVLRKRTRPQLPAGFRHGLIQRFA